MQLFIGGCFSLQVFLASVQLVIKLFELWLKVITAGLKEAEL